MKSLKFSFSLVSIIVLLGVSCIAFVANAQTTTTSDRAPSDEGDTIPEETRRLEVLENVRDTTDVSGTTTTEIRSIPTGDRPVQRLQLTETVQARILNLAANMSNRMDAAVRRLTQIGTRLETRMAKLQARGINTEVAKTHLADANSALKEASALLLDIDRAAFAAASSESPRETWATTKATYQTIKAAILRAHASLRATLAALKEAVAAPEGEGTVVTEEARPPVAE